MLAVSIPNFATSFAFVETATKCFATEVSSPFNPASDHARAVCALVIVSSVVKVFEEMMNRVSAGSRSLDGFRKIGPIDIGNEAKRQVALAVVAKGLIRHDRSKIGASDPDVDDVANGLAGVTLPIAASHAV